MNFRSVRAGAFVGFFLIGARLWASETVQPPTNDTEDSQPVDEGEGILPPSPGIAVSTGTLTPISPYVEKSSYDQALEELAQAHQLWEKGALEAASDMALAAYEDLLQIRHFRGNRRKKLRVERRQAATLYIETGIAYVNEWVKTHGAGLDAKKEGAERLEDLRDVARDYEDLSRRLTKAIEALSAPK